MPAIWAALTAALSVMVKSRIGFWIASALASLGLTLAVQKFAMQPVLSMVQQYWGGIPADVAAWMAYMGADRVITIILSAYAAAATMSAVRLRKSSGIGP